MMYAHQQIVHAIMAGTGITKDPRHPGLEWNNYLYGSTPIYLVNCRERNPGHLDQWAGWYVFEFAAANNVRYSALAIRWTGANTIKWEMMFEPAALIFGRRIEPRTWDRNEFVTHGKMKIVRAGWRGDMPVGFKTGGVQE
jgi:hypothetical protein